MVFLVERMVVRRLSAICYEWDGVGRRGLGLTLVLWTTDSATTGETWSSFSVGMSTTCARWPFFWFCSTFGSADSYCFQLWRSLLLLLLLLLPLRPQPGIAGVCLSSECYEASRAHGLVGDTTMV